MLAYFFLFFILLMLPSTFQTYRWEICLCSDSPLGLSSFLSFFQPSLFVSVMISITVGGLLLLLLLDSPCGLSRQTRIFGTTSWVVATCPLKPLSQFSAILDILLLLMHYLLSRKRRKQKPSTGKQCTGNMQRVLVGFWLPDLVLPGLHSLRPVIWRDQMDYLFSLYCSFSLM